MTASRRRELVGILLATAFIGSLASGAVHELGHAFAATLVGARVREIQLFWVFGPPHVSYSGQLGTTSAAAICLAGMMSSFLCGLVLLLILPFKRLPAGWAVASSLVAALFVSQSLAWAILPIMVMVGAKPHDDVISFMDNAGWSPAVTELLGLSLLGIGVALFFWRTRFLARIQEFKNQAELPKATDSQGCSL